MWAAAVAAAAAAAAGLLAFTGVAAQEPDFSIPSAYTDWNNDRWELSTRELIPGRYQSRLSLANGYLGCAFAAAGPFFEADKNFTDPNGPPPAQGWPLDNPRVSFCTVAGFWNAQPNTTRSNYPWLLQYGWESVISGVPHWGGIIFDVNGARLDAEVANTSVQSFTSSLSARHGLGKWSYAWTPENSDGLRLDVNFTAFVSRARPNVAVVRADITPSRDTSGTVTDLIDGRSALRTTFASRMFDSSENGRSIWSAVHPSGVENVTAYLFSTVGFAGGQVDLQSRRLADLPWVPSSSEATIGQTYNISLRAGQTLTVYKFVGGASSDAFANPDAVARNASRTAEAAGWDALLAEHQAAWEALMTPESVDNYANPDGQLPNDVNIFDLQIASIFAPYYLLQNTLRAGTGPGLGQNSISVGGLTSDSYAGLVFWDADTFMSPGLLVAHPEYARQIAEYRIAKYPQARQNAIQNGFSEGAVLYPWTSARYGNCTGTGPCTDYQYHLNSDIALMLLEHRNVTGDETWWREKAWPIYQGVAQMYSELLEFNSSTGKYGISNHSDPDEYANGINNGAFTLASASKVLTTANYFRELYGLGANETWTQMANNVQIPYDVSGITVEYEGMNNSVPVKQADVVLSTYPFNYRNNYTEQQSLNDLDYYAGKQSPDGPAMTYSILSIIANQVSPSGCSAYTYALDAFEPYTRAPWYQFSEQQIDIFEENGGTRPAFPFLTGHGGFNQVGPFGWLGLRLDTPALYIDPSLPPQIRHVKVRRFYFGGATVDAVMNYTHTTLTRLPTNNTFVRDVWGASPVPVVVGDERRETHALAVGQTVTVANRGYSGNLTFAHNLLQCLPATTAEPHRPGQYALAAVDGAISTSWQPLRPERAAIVVNMTGVPFQPVVGAAFNWGLTPPVSARITLTNSSTFSGPAVVVALDNITISDAYEANDARIRPYSGNTTNVAFASAAGAGGGPVYTGRYARLEIEGTQGPRQELGAQVAEFALIGASGSQLVKRWEPVDVASGV